MSRRTALCLLLLPAAIGQALAAGPNAGNHNALLKGTYQIAYEIACVTSDQGFSDPPALQALGVGGPVIDHDTGTILFDGHGNATEIRHGISIVPQQIVAGSSAVSTYAITCRYNYTVNADKSFALSGSCSGMISGGPGLTVDVSPAGGVGQLSESRTMFTISSVTPVRQLVRLGNNTQTQRLCGASATGIRVHP